MDPPRAEPLLRDREARAAGAEQAVAGHAHALVDDLGVPADAPEVLGRMLHRRDVAHDPHARRVGGHDEHRGATVRSRLRVGDRHHDQEVGDRAVRGEPLVAVDHPVVAVLRPRASRAASGPSRRCPGSVIEKAERSSPASSGSSQLLLLVRRPGEREDLGVARVGRVVAEHERRVGGAAEDLVHQAELDLAEPLPAQLGRQVRGPQPALLDLLAQRRDRALEPVLAELLEDGLDRPDLGAHEVGHPVQLALELRFGREVPRHGVS